MMGRLFLLAATIQATSAADATKSSSSPPKQSCLHEVLHGFDLLDPNADGKLSREEINLAITTNHPTGASPSEDVPQPPAALMTVLQELARMRTENQELIEQVKHMAAHPNCPTGNHSHGGHEHGR